MSNYILTKNQHICTYMYYLTEAKLLLEAKPWCGSQQDLRLYLMYIITGSRMICELVNVKYRWQH